MNESMNTDPESKLRQEIDSLPWSALARHFAFGRVYEVRAPLSLLEAALILQNDDRPTLESAMAKGLFALPDDADAKTWQENERLFDVLVISPFVLVQKSK